MRALALGIALALCSWSPVAGAQHAPAGDRFWEAPPPPANPAKAPLLVTGAVAGGVGVLLIGVSGITALVAVGHAARLDDTCQGRYCVRGTPGGDNYEAVDEMLDVSGVLLGVGVPLMISGLTFTIIGASLRGEHDGPRIAGAPETLRVGVGAGGAELEVTF